MINKKLGKYGVTMISVLTVMFLTAMLLPNSLSAKDFSPAQSVEILEKGQAVNGPGFFSGRLVQVNGTVEGTTFATGQEVQINGIINGDLFVAAQTILIKGEINGNIYTAGQNLKIETQCTGDVFAAGQTIDIAKEAMIGRDLFAAGQRISLDGTVQRQFSGGGSDILISGTIGQNANLDAVNIRLLDGAIINGNLSYKSENQAIITSGSKIGGLTDWQKTEAISKQQKSTAGSTFGSILLSIASALLIWFLVKIWWPDFWAQRASSITEQPLKTIGMGALVFLLAPLIIILLMITIIGLPLGIILGLAYGVTLYLSKIIVAAFMGAWLTKRFGWAEKNKGVWLVLLSLAVLVLLIEVPILGVLIWLLVVFAGLGSLALSRNKKAA